MEQNSQYISHKVTWGVLSYDVQQVLPGVFHVTSDTAFDLGMLFLRSQEYYESQNESVRGRKFNLIELMRWYAVEFRNSSSFTYPSDWCGYNVPDTAVRTAIVDAPDFNIFDEAMQSIMLHIMKLNGKDAAFYLIGSTMSNEIVMSIVESESSSLFTTFHHELAHALYYIDHQYRRDVNAIMRSMHKGTFTTIVDSLNKLGYHVDVHLDESHAYMVAGINDISNVRVSGVQSKVRTRFLQALSGKKFDMGQPELNLPASGSVGCMLCDYGDSSACFDPH